MRILGAGSARRFKVGDRSCIGAPGEGEESESEKAKEKSSFFFFNILLVGRSGSFWGIQVLKNDS